MFKRNLHCEVKLFKFVNCCILTFCVNILINQFMVYDYKAIAYMLLSLTLIYPVVNTIKYLFFYKVYPVIGIHWRRLHDH